ncbi:MAG TPA: efflux RND transporter periplasmic adaptor subunit [Chthoniobacterales bacterium]|nr:efflux RND transporter periplasmic adaptor subunit [Chthoniobacterales bacterium]
MTTMAKANVITRQAVGKLEHRFGRKGLYLGGGVILLVVLALTLRGFTSKEKTPARPPPRPVAAAKVITQDVPLYIDEIGTCAAFETVQVQAQVNGQIIAREFKDGDDVKKGDLLFRIDPRPYEAALAHAQADLALNQANLKRQETLRSQNVTAGQELDTAKANAQKAEAAVKAAQVNLDHCYIKSPIDGRVGLRNIDVGNVVGPGSPALVMIQGMDPIYTDFTVAEPDLPLVRRYLNGEKLKVLTDAEDDDLPPREGELTFIDNSLQPGTGTIKARAITPNPDRALWPSQFVHARLILETLKDSKLVPSSAVQIGQNGPYVFVVKEDSTLELRQVRPGQRHGDLTVVTEGVKEGERVVVSGQLQLAPGAKVTVQEVESVAPSAQPALSNSSK